jgi:hypothetical protein
MATTYALPSDFDVVSRRVNQRPSSFRHVVHLLPLGVGQLRFDEPFTQVNDDLEPGWHTTGSVYTRRGPRFARATRVDVELRAWSTRACELRIRPVSRRLPMWSKRRQRRYFDHAHHSADQLVRWLDAAVRRHDVTVALTRRRFADQRPVTGVLQHVR